MWSVVILPGMWVRAMHGPTKKRVQRINKKQITWKTKKRVRNADGPLPGAR